MGHPLEVTLATPGERRRGANSPLDQAGTADDQQARTNRHTTASPLFPDSTRNGILAYHFHWDRNSSLTTAPPGHSLRYSLQMQSAASIAMLS